MFNLSTRENITKEIPVLMDEDQPDNPDSYSHVVFYPKRITPRLERLIKEKLPNDAWQTGRILDILMPLLKSWDLARQQLDDDGNVVVDAKGKPVLIPIPCDKENAETIGMENLMLIMNAVTGDQDVVPGEANAAPLTAV